MEMLWNRNSKNGLKYRGGKMKRMSLLKRLMAPTVVSSLQKWAIFLLSLVVVFLMKHHQETITVSVNGLKAIKMTCSSSGWATTTVSGGGREYSEITE